MKVLLQRVKQAEVRVDDTTVGAINTGLLAFICAERGDRDEDVSYFATKVSKIRMFPDQDGKTNLSVQDVGGSILAVSQFTLAADWRKGNRPGFSGAEHPERAQALYEAFCQTLRDLGVTVETGVFGAEMQVSLINDGPFTVMMDSRD